MIGVYRLTSLLPRRRNDAEGKIGVRLVRRVFNATVDKPGILLAGELFRTQGGGLPDGFAP